MDIQARIAQFENMAAADPDNEMAHYSLASAYMQAGRYIEAAASYQRCAAAAPHMSKAYQLAGDCLIKASNPEQAAEVLAAGYRVAAERGDRMPMNAIAQLLRSIGLEPPAVAGRTISLAGGGDQGLEGATKLDRAPFRGPLGQWIAANVSREKWNAWIAQGTKVINELRLDLSREPDAATYDTHMREYLGIDDELHQQILSGQAS